MCLPCMPFFNRPGYYEPPHYHNVPPPVIGFAPHHHPGPMGPMHHPGPGGPGFGGPGGPGFGGPGGGHHGGPGGGPGHHGGGPHGR